MKKFVLCWLVVSLFFGGLNLNTVAASEEPVFSAPHITIISTETGLVMQIILPDGSIEQVPTPPRGIRPFWPRKDPVAVNNYKEAINELEKQCMTKQNPEIKRALCYLYLKSGRNVKAAECYQQAADLFQNTHDIAAQAVARNQLALLLWEFEEQEDAIQQAQQSFKVYQQYVEKLHEAEAEYQQVLQSARAKNDQEQQLLVQHQLALISYALGKTEKSKEYAEEVLKLFEKIESPLMGKQRMEKLIVNQIRELLEELH